MAKAAHGTKSQAIHEYLSTNSTAAPKLIVEELKQKGIEVSFGLASAVKYGGKSKTKGTKPRRQGAAANRPAPKVAITGTQSIQDFMRRHPGAGLKEIQKGLKTEGIKVSESLIKAVKYRKARKSGRPSVRVAARKVSAKRALANGSAVTVEQLLEVKRLSNALGGTSHVRQALETLEQLR